MAGPGTAMGIANYQWNTTQQAPLGFVHTEPASYTPDGVGEISSVYVGLTLWAKPGSTALGSNTTGLLLKHGTNGSFDNCVLMNAGACYDTAVGVITTDLFAFEPKTQTNMGHPEFVEGDVVYGFVVCRGQTPIQCGIGELKNQEGIIPDQGGADGQWDHAGTLPGALSDATLGFSFGAESTQGDRKTGWVSIIG